MSLPECVHWFPPQAPSMEEWEALTPAERQAAVDALTTTMTAEEEEHAMSEGDAHRIACMVLGESLRDHWDSLKRRVYVGSDLSIYYPRTPRFSPDLFVAFDVAPGERDRWVVAVEGKGPDFVLEVLHLGSRSKDMVDNVARCARLGIPEYFVYDRGRQRLYGYRLPDPTAERYQPVVPQFGRYTSEVLGLDLVIEDERLRFYSGQARVIEPRELRFQLQRALDQKERLLDAQEKTLAEEQRLREEEQRLREEEQRMREEEQRLREEEQQARQLAEQRLAEALARIAALEGR